MLSAGTNDTVVYDVPAGYAAALTANSETHIWHSVKGGYHGGGTIRPHIYNFVRNIFQLS